MSYLDFKFYYVMVIPLFYNPLSLKATFIRRPCNSNSDVSQSVIAVHYQK